MMPKAAGFACADVERFVDAYVDGEFADDERGGFDEHLGGCAACARTVRFHAAWKAGFKAAAPRLNAPTALRQRLALSLEREPSVRDGWRQGAWLVPAAALALIIGGLAVKSVRGSSITRSTIETAIQGPPVEITGSADNVREWFRKNKVAFSVRPPEMPGALLVGGRITNIQEHQAAYLLYDVRGNRVAVFMFDPSNFPLEVHHRRHLGTQEVFVDGERGYHVAVVRNRGVGYAFASDLDEDQMLQLVSSAIQH